jgi:NAD(P)-dependent dehydrogenase (short-subunit alcohol dehydrogenase family)
MTTVQQIDSFDGRIVVVTGGASGIGLALAGAFAREGARVVVADIEADALERARAVLPHDTLAIVTDVSRLDDVQRLADATLERFGRVDIVCNNAGVTTFNRLERQTLDDWHWVLDVNLWGVVHGVMTFLPILRAQGTPAHVVNTASAAGLVGGVPFMAPYAVSKVGVIALSESLRAELEFERAPIGVSVLCPGFTNTNVLEGDRNRPRHHAAGARTEEADQVVAYVRDTFTAPAGKEPEEVAELVLDAITERRFWVLSHAGMRADMARRFDAILDAAPDE